MEIHTQHFGLCPFLLSTDKSLTPTMGTCLVLAVIALKKRGTYFEDNDVLWVKFLVMNCISSADAVPNVVDSERAEILVMWPIVNDTVHRKSNDVNMPRLCGMISIPHI